MDNSNNSNNTNITDNNNHDGTMLVVEVPVVVNDKSCGRNNSSFHHEGIISTVSPFDNNNNNNEGTIKEVVVEQEDTTGTTSNAVDDNDDDYGFNNTTDTDNNDYYSGENSTNNNNNEPVVARVHFHQLSPTATTTTTTTKNKNACCEIQNQQEQQPRQRLVQGSNMIQKNHTNTKHTNNTKNKKDPRIVKRSNLQIVKRANKIIYRFKTCFIGSLLITALVTSITVYQYIQQEEQNEFTIQFIYLANQIVSKLHVNAQTKMEAIGGFAIQIQAYSLYSNSSWPNVTLPYFEEHVMATKSLTDAYAILLFPIVTTETRKGWEEYSIQNNDWINQSYTSQQIQVQQKQVQTTTEEQETLTTRASNETWFDFLWGNHLQNPEMPNFETANGMSSTIFATRAENDTNIQHIHIEPYSNDNDNENENHNNNVSYHDDDSSSYFPQWQTSPISWYYQTTINANYGHYDDFYMCTKISIETKSACLGKAWSDDNSPGRITTLLYPIFDTFHTTTSTTNDTTEDHHQKVTAFLGVDLFWESYLKGILPSNENHNKVYVVIESTCNDTFTLELVDGTTNFLYDGQINIQQQQQIQQQYGTKKVTTRFGEYLYNTNNNDNNSTSSSDSSSSQFDRTTYIGPPLYDGFCQYDITIYPSKELENLYVTNKPIVYSIVVGCIFCATILFFLIYDFIVERRQRIVLRTAETSDAIVSSLFPTAFKDRLYIERTKQIESHNHHNHDNSNNNNGNNNNNNNNTTNKLQKNFLFFSPSNHRNKFNNKKSNNKRNKKQQYHESYSEDYDEEGPPTERFTTTSTSYNKKDDDFILTSSPQQQHNETSGSTSTNNNNINNIYSSSCGDGGSPMVTTTPTTPTMTMSSAIHNLHHPFSSFATHHKRRSNEATPTPTQRTTTNGKAIAELYPDTTVLFADIAGFTKWSSGRNPNDVFLLLETLYSTFDSIALRLKVFKIETIGDCYVAVTGLPEPQMYHAIIMTRFAHEMLQSMEHVLKHKIVHELGSESLELTMRVGMHSGPVIAGVLRGAKARFQLFGDTMNTAARMESNGQKGCIHISQATADLLNAANKSHWLSQREEMIEAKGKGKMQTYWVKLGPKNKGGGSSLPAIRDSHITTDDKYE